MAGGSADNGVNTSKNLNTEIKARKRKNRPKKENTKEKERARKNKKRREAKGA